MIIENVAACFPSKSVNNEDVVELIHRYSDKEFEGDLHKTLRIVKALLDRSGLATRNWRSEGERPIDLLATAVQSALRGSSLQPKDIDLFIYVGIGGGFREPGNSYMAARSLGVINAQCFDIIDACMSWTRALYVVDSLFKTGNFRSAMIVNAEFNMTPGGPLFPANFSLKNKQQLEYVLPSYTIGEAATATLLLPRDPENFCFTFRSQPGLSDLCAIPAVGFEGFYQEDHGIGQLWVDRFTALGSALHHHLEQELPGLLADAKAADDKPNIVLTHSSSSTEWQRLAEKHGFAEKIYHIYPHTGNVVSASIPAALALASSEGRLRRGDRVMCLMGSAGMSFAVTAFDF